MFRAIAVTQWKWTRTVALLATPLAPDRLATVSVVVLMVPVLNANVFVMSLVLAVELPPV